MKTIELRLDAEADFRYDEAMKTLRTNILLSGSNVRNILITSTAPNEGKSTVAFDLALSFVDMGRNVCFIDADIRKSEFMSRYVQGNASIGLSQILSGQVEFGQGILAVRDIPNLHLVLAGPYSPNPTELFEDVMCEKFFAFIAAQNYDTVIIDCPPIGTVIDAAILTRYADGAIMVIESEMTSRRLFQKAKEQLERTGVRFLGAVLNKVNMTKSGYYHSYYRYGRYGRKYEQYDKYYKRDEDNA